MTVEFWNGYWFGTISAAIVIAIVLVVGVATWAKKTGRLR